MTWSEQAMDNLCSAIQLIEEIRFDNEYYANTFGEFMRAMFADSRTRMNTYFNEWEIKQTENMICFPMFEMIREGFKKKNDTK